MKKLDLKNKKFGKLTVIRPTNKRKRGYVVHECLCDCGNSCFVTTNNLKGSNSKSCGCLRRKTVGDRFSTHRKTGTSEFNAYYSAKQRCYNPKSKQYKDYGGRGIKFCKRWLGKNGFKNFLKDIGPKPSFKHSLDRIDNNGPYCDWNCR